MSLVDVSPSTVMALNVSSAASASARCSRSGPTSASVVRNPSMVAMFGSIMPAPLAIPPTWKTPSGVVARTAASFAHRSVVMMASAAAPCPSRLSAPTACVMPWRSFSPFSWTPITPVEETRTCSAEHPMARAVSVAIVRATASPWSPVQAFAHPLLTTMDDAAPCDTRRCSRVTTTGAATARFVVKMPAARAAGVETIIARSSPDGLMPHATPAAVKPAGAVMPPVILSRSLIRSSSRCRVVRSDPNRAR